MRRSAAEKELQARFAKSYLRNQAPVMRRIEQSVCGCDYGGTSWATRREVDDIARKLALRPGHRLMDLGAGSGWPGIYLAALSGCDITLVDLPAEGLAIAAARARADRLPGFRGAATADGRALPYGDKCFDAITHSDVLCCLPDKQAVLAECRRTVADGGRMIFTVLVLGEGLSGQDRARAIDFGPPHVTSETEYAEMARLTGWETVGKLDLSARFLDTAKAFLAVDRANQTELAALLGREDCELRLEKDADYIAAITGGILRRELYELRAA